MRSERCSPKHSADDHAGGDEYGHRNERERERRFSVHLESVDHTLSALCVWMSSLSYNETKRLAS